MRRLKHFESAVRHRVAARTLKTESKGRILPRHCTVCIMPKADEQAQIEINSRRSAGGPNLPPPPVPAGHST